MPEFATDSSNSVPAELSLARPARQLSQSPLREILPLLSQPSVISLALGMPASEMFPAARFREASVRVLSDPTAPQYGVPTPRLKEQLAELMAMRQVACTEDQIFLTAGAQQGLSLLGQLLVDPGDTVITEEVIYDGMQMVLQASGANVLTVPARPGSGMDLDALESLLEEERRPSFIYTIPEGHNPLGVSMSLENRIRLLELARRWRVPVVEDDAYGFLSYEENPPPALKALDEEWVLHLGSFSKTLAPALRVGWIVAPPRLMSRLSALKQANDFDTANLSQRIVSSYLDGGDFPRHLRALQDEYRGRRDAVLTALRRHLPNDVRWHKPSSGLFVWLELPSCLDTYDLLRVAVVSERVAFLPGRAFTLDSGGEMSRFMRLSFGNCTAEILDEGVARLARVVNRFLADHDRWPTGLGGIWNTLHGATAAGNGQRLHN